MSDTPRPVFPRHPVTDSCLPLAPVRPALAGASLGASPRRGSVRTQQAARDAGALVSVFTVGETGVGVGCSSRTHSRGW